MVNTLNLNYYKSLLKIPVKGNDNNNYRCIYLLRTFCENIVCSFVYKWAQSAVWYSCISAGGDSKGPTYIPARFSGHSLPSLPIFKIGFCHRVRHHRMCSATYLFIFEGISYGTYTSF